MTSGYSKDNLSLTDCRVKAHSSIFPTKLFIGTALNVFYAQIVLVKH